MASNNPDTAEQSIFNILQQFITTELLHDRPGIQIQPEDPLIQSGIIDSLGILKLMNFVEEEFDITIAPEEIALENFATLQALSSFLQRKLNDSTN